uniref:Variable surface lipoprotein n=1 Tax=Neospora caninum (strain Liverpool) TaxID=572307 RepID=A0A0F7UI71_NEOCL|nr:TPA: variable surface lipoprotein [Neospora caninum Liverpool]
MAMPSSPSMAVPAAGPYGVNPTLRPPPQVVEQMLDELEEKARHYFVLYTREKKAREKTERYSFWLQKELAEHKEKLLKSADYIESLQNKFDELRGDPEMIRDTLQRIDLMYAQVDTLVQALAGVCGFAAVKDSTREQLLQCALDYLYPCRALDPRLHELYGVLYYYRLGESKKTPGVPPPPPEPSYVPLSEGAGGPWIKPSPYTLFLNPAAGQTTLQKNLAETQKIVDAEAAEKAAAEEKKEATPAKRIIGSTTKRGETSAKAKTEPAKPAVKKPASTGASPASGPPKREPVDPKATLKGFTLFVRRLEGFKRPPSSKVESLRIAVRTDDESATESKKKEGRFMLIDKASACGFLSICPRSFRMHCGGSPGNEEATFNLLVEFPTIPPKKPGGNPKFVIDVYDNKAFAALGRADKPFSDKDLATEDAVWEVKDSSGKAFGKLICTVTPLPLNAPLPCEAGGAAKDAGGAAPANKSGGEEKAKEEAKQATPAGAIKKPELAKLAVKKPDLPKPGGASLGSPGGAKPAEAKSAPGPPSPPIKKLDLSVPGKVEVKKEEATEAKPGSDGAKKPMEIKKPALAPKPGGAEAAKKDAVGTKSPEAAGAKTLGSPTGPGAAVKKPDLPKPGGAIKKPELGAKPGLPPAGKGDTSPPAVKPSAPAPPQPAKPGVVTPPKPGGAATKPVLTPAKSGITPVKPGLTPVKPALTPAKSGITPVKPGLTPVKPVLTPAKSGITPVKPGLTPVKPVLTPAKSGITPVKPGLTPVKPVLTPAKSGITPVKPGLTPVKPVLTPAKSGITPVKPGLTPVKPGLTPVKPGLTPVKPGAAKPTAVKPPGPKPGAPGAAKVDAKAAKPGLVKPKIAAK